MFVKYENPPAAKRAANLSRLIELSKTVELNPDWSLVIGEASVRFVKKDRTRTLKIDSCNVFTLDVGLTNVKSNTFSCKTADEAWKMTHQTLKAFTGIRSTQ